MTLDEFITKAKQIHANKFDYSKVAYVNTDTKVEIICPLHGSFWKTPYSHISKRKSECPCCNSSKGEKAIQENLVTLGILFKRQVRFKDCRDKKPLPFDFGLYQNDKLLGLIEYQGEQHYRMIKRWGGMFSFQKLQMHDGIKNLYCVENEIPFLEISFREKEKIGNLVENFWKSLF